MVSEGLWWGLGVEVIGLQPRLCGDRLAQLLRAVALLGAGGGAGSLLGLEGALWGRQVVWEVAMEVGEEECDRTGGKMLMLEETRGRVQVICLDAPLADDSSQLQPRPFDLLFPLSPVLLDLFPAFLLLLKTSLQSSCQSQPS